jgi:hypothetical protein
MSNPHHTPAALAALATDLGTFLAGTQTMMSMFGKPGETWKAWERIRDALNLHGYHTAEQARDALLASVRQENNITSQAVANARVRRTYIERAEKAEAERAALLAAARHGAEMRDALRRVGIGTSDECGDVDEMVEWFVTTENGEEGCGTLDNALARLCETAVVDAARHGAADTARLDWMQEHAADVEAVMDMDPEAEVGFRVRCYDTLDVGEGATLRDAIDAARADNPKETND